MTTDEERCVGSDRGLLVSEGGKFNIVNTGCKQTDTMQEDLDRSPFEKLSASNKEGAYTTSQECGKGLSEHFLCTLEKKEIEEKDRWVCWGDTGDGNRGKEMGIVQSCIVRI